MLTQKGFTVIEILVVLIILGILFSIAIPGYYSAISNSQAQAVEHNLMAIAAAQQKYNEDHGNYFSSSDFGAINSNLSLSLTAVDGYSYTCAAGTCSASNQGTTVTVDTNGNLTCTPSPCP